MSHPLSASRRKSYGRPLAPGLSALALRSGAELHPLRTDQKTADERILPQGTAYLTDLGLTGPFDSVIGVEPELAIQRFRTGMPNRFEPAAGRARLQGAVIRIDPESGRALAIERIQRDLLS